MRQSIRRLALLSVVALLAITIVNLNAGALYARSPRAGFISPIGETVAADPGEDPHMKIDDPGTDPLPVQDDGCTGQPSGRSIVPLSGGTSGARDLPVDSRVKTKLLLLFRLAFGAIAY